MTKYTAIVAKYGDVIGVDKSLLLQCREDMAHFKETTQGGVVVMGRATIESLPFKLTDRFTIGLSENYSWFSDYHKLNKLCTSLRSFDEYILEEDINEVFVCGGSKIYDLFTDRIDTWIVTEYDDVQLPEGNLVRLTDKTMTTIDTSRTIMTKRISSGLISYKIGKSV